MPRQDTPSGATRRRHAADFKRDLVERCLQPGASVSGIALQNGVNANVLFRWRREHLRAVSRAQDHGAAPAVLLPVEVAATAIGTKPEAPASRSLESSPGVIEIDIGIARVRLRGSVDEANVRCVLHTLKDIA
jgi:transposase